VALVRESGVPDMSLRNGEATAAGLEPGSADVMMLRHVLAHNGDREHAIVTHHLASRIRPGGVGVSG